MSNHQERFCFSGVTLYRSCRIPCRLVCCFSILILILLWMNKLWFMFLPFILSFGRATGFVPSSILDLYVFLSSRQDISHLDDFILHQVFVRVGDLQPTDECSGNHVVIAAIHQGHLALKITDDSFI